MARVDRASPRIGALIANGEQISESEREETDDENEDERLPVQDVDACIFARFFQAALRDDRPVQVGHRGVCAHHGNVAIILFDGEAHRFRVVKIARQSTDLRHDG